MPSPNPPVLLTVGQYYGTLAAARCFGRAGIPVTLAESAALAPARWSRHVTRRVPFPDLSAVEPFLARLLAFGAESPGHVLLPCSDDEAWLLAAHREDLADSFTLLPTPFSAIDALLDKPTLHERARAAGLATPDTWLPRSEPEALDIASREGFPLLLKPRTQVFSRLHSKGALVATPAELSSRFRELLSENRYSPEVLAERPDALFPMLQRYHPEAQHSIYGLSGYVGAGGEILAIRASRKVLQRPRKLGIGLCFEEAPVDPTLAAALSTLCRSVAYRGVFEAELIETPSAPILIDFNPRFYSQMAFDIARGLPLPLFAYADARGDTATLTQLTAASHEAETPGDRVYIHRLLFELMLRAQKASGRMTPSDESHWRRWWSRHRAAATDAVSDPTDPLPLGVDIASHLTSFARHPRSFVRSMVLDR